MVLFVLYLVLTFEFVGEILWYGHLNETSSSVLSYGAIYLVNYAVFGQRFYYSVTQLFAYIFNCTICFPTFEKLKLGYSFSYIQIIWPLARAQKRKKTTLRASFNSSTLQKKSINIKRKTQKAPIILPNGNILL